MGQGKGGRVSICQKLLEQEVKLQGQDIYECISKSFVISTIFSYLGYTPRIKFTYGETYGNTTARWFQDYRASQLNTSKERMGRGGDKFLPFPTYYTNNPDHVVGARTSSRDRWLAAPKYKLLNLDDRDTAIKKYDKVGSLFKHLIPAVQKLDIAIHYQRIAQ